MSMLKELEFSDIVDNLRGLTSSTKIHYNNFNISCGNPIADQMLSPNEENKVDFEEAKNQDDEEQNTLGYSRVTHNYLPKELII